MPNIKFKLETKAKKGNCPSCKHTGVFRYFEGFHNDDRYGRCERLNECGFYKSPAEGNEKATEQKQKEIQPAKEIIYLDTAECEKQIADQSSNFHKYCLSLGISFEHLKKWNVGTSKKGETIFFFTTGETRGHAPLSNTFCNKKSGKYQPDGHREKGASGEFYTLKQPEGNKKYILPLYGSHLLKSGKKTIIVESEKTAVIASFFYADYDFVSCGSANGLSDGTGGTNNKISPLIGREVYWLCDADKAGRDNSSIRNIEKWFLKYHIIDLFRRRTDGWDIADEIATGNKPLILPEKNDQPKILSERPSNTIYIPANTEAKVDGLHPINTLFLITNDRSANLIDHQGIDCVSMDDLYGFTQKKSGEKLHKAIEYVVERCKVKNIVLLGNADCLTINYDPDKNDQDLSERLLYYFKAVEKFKSCSTCYDNIEFFFIHLKENFSESANRLEILFDYIPDEKQNIIDDLNLLNKADKFFTGFNVEAHTIKRVQEYFYLDYNDKKTPKHFYNTFEEILQQNEFVFEGSKWKYSFTYDGLFMVKHKDSFSYARIGCDYVKQIFVPNSQGMFERRLEPWKKGEIIQDYVKKLGITTFLDMVPKYDAFCNVPANDDTFNQVINNCYNMYFKLTHKLTEGKFPYIEQFLKHVFQNTYQDKYELVLDYLSIMYNSPAQNLPIIVLTSKEKETGKSTFQWLLSDIFGENVAVIGNEELTDKFNDDYASKLVICVSEGFIEKRLIIEKLKSWATDPYINLNTKFKSRQRISFFAKVVITTNDEKDFIRIDSDETRFLIVKVPQIEKKNPDLRELMKAEIPAFLSYLKTRTLKYAKAGRHWFSTEDMQTEALKALKTSSRRHIYKMIVEYIRSLFLEFQVPEIKMTSIQIRDALNESYDYKKTSILDIQKELEEEMGLVKQKNHRYSMPRWKSDPEEDNEPTIEWASTYFDKDHKEKSHIGCFYIFPIQNFLKPSEIPEDIKIIIESETQNQGKPPF